MLVLSNARDAPPDSRLTAEEMSEYFKLVHEQVHHDESTGKPSTAYPSRNNVAVVEPLPEHLTVRELHYWRIHRERRFNNMLYQWWERVEHRRARNPVKKLVHVVLDKIMTQAALPGLVATEGPPAKRARLAE